jgi:hypothetical protein
MASHLLRLPTLIASATLIVMLGACDKHDAGVGSRTADARNPTPKASEKIADETLPKECLEYEAAHRACVENIAASMERAGLVDGAKQMRNALPDEITQARARWQSEAASNMEGLRRSCIAARDTQAALPQCAPALGMRRPAASGSNLVGQTPNRNVEAAAR